MEIVKYPAPILQTPTELVTDIESDVKPHIEAMFKAMYQAKGVGLAAPQVGLGKRFFVMNANREGKPGDGGEQVWINPEIIHQEDEARMPEGCLSLPGIWGEVDRATRVRLRALDLEGKERYLEAEGLEAQAFQHEIDHLDGKLFIRLMSATDLAMQRSALKALEREYTQAEAQREKKEAARRRRQERKARKERKGTASAEAPPPPKKPRPKKH